MCANLNVLSLFDPTTETTQAAAVVDGAAQETTTNIPEAETVTEVTQVANKDALPPLIIEKEVTTPPPVIEEDKG